MSITLFLVCIFMLFAVLASIYYDIKCIVEEEGNDGTEEDEESEDDWKDAWNT